MVSSNIKTDISKILDNIHDERFLNSVLVMMEAFDSAAPQLSAQQLKELEVRIADHKAGKTENFSWKQSLDEVRNSLQK